MGSRLLPRGARLLEHLNDRPLTFATLRSTSSSWWCYRWPAKVQEVKKDNQHIYITMFCNGNMSIYPKASLTIWRWDRPRGSPRIIKRVRGITHGAKNAAPIKRFKGFGGLQPIYEFVQIAPQMRGTDRPIAGITQQKRGPMKRTIPITGSIHVGWGPLTCTILGQMPITAIL